MKFKVDDREIYLNIKNLSSVSISNDKHWETKQDIYHVEVSNNGMIIRVYSTESKSSAEKLLEDIANKAEEVIPDKTYLDGFKDGTEYALKLISKDRTCK